MMGNNMGVVNPPPRQIANFEQGSNLPQNLPVNPALNAQKEEEEKKLKLKLEEEKKIEIEKARISRLPPKEQ